MTLTKPSLVLAALAVSTLATRTAAADTKSWAAVKAKLPASTAVVVGFDIKEIRGLSSFQALLGTVYSESQDVKQMVDVVKTACSIDVTAAISDVTVVANMDEKGLVVIGLDGLDQGKLVGCVNKVLAEQDPKLKMTSKPGKVTEYAMTGEKDKIYAAWIANDVVAIGFDAHNRDALDRLIAGKPAAAALAAQIKSANTAALVWGAATVNKDGIKGGFGAITSTKGKLALSVKLTANSPAVAKQLATDGKKDLADKIKSTEQQAPKVSQILKAVVLEQRGTADLAIECSMPEAELPSLLPAFDKVF